MESECPDPFPGLRMLPDNFDLEFCLCCNCIIHYFGTLRHPSGAVFKREFMFIFSPKTGAIVIGEGSWTSPPDELCALTTKVRLRTVDLEDRSQSAPPQCTG